MDLGLEGTSALITGASRGIGWAIARALWTEGVEIMTVARTAPERSFETRHFHFGADLTDNADFERMWANAEKFGPIDILINNVGGGGRWGSNQPHTSNPSIWGDCHHKNYDIARELTLRVIPAMVLNNWGRVVTITSIFGRQAGAQPQFAAAKAAQTALMASLARVPSYARRNVTFNSVAPGAVMTKGSGWEKERDRNQVAFDAMVDMEFPMGRLGTPEDVADVVTFLCSNKARYINGASIVVDGGEGVTL